MTLKLTLQIIAILSLISCSNVSVTDVKQFVAKTKQSHNIHIEEIPKLAEYEQNNYSSTNLNDPFVGPVNGRLIVQVSNQITKSTIQQQKPDYERPKEYLENFPLDSLTMVGTVEKNGETWALIIDRSNMIHRVREGNYLGENSGQITQINKDNISLKELVPDGQGGWVTRDAQVSIVNKKNSKE